MKIGLDLDGTILDCRPRQTQLLAVLCRAFALAVDIERYWSLKREGCSNRVALVRLGVNEAIADNVASLWERAVEDVAWLRFDPLLPNAKETLGYWYKQGHSLHLISARRNHANAYQQLRVLGLDFFKSIEFVDPFKVGAKQPALAELRPDVYIGDTERDAHCADAVGVRSILVSSGLRDKAYLQKKGNWLVIDKLSSVLLPRMAGALI